MRSIVPKPSILIISAALMVPLVACMDSQPTAVDDGQSVGADVVPPGGGELAAEVSTFDYSMNMHPMGVSGGVFPNSDLAFWDHTAYHGNFEGFRIVDISAPGHPVQVLDYRDCAGGQGDVVVWDNILVRSWDAPAPAGATCGGQPVPQSASGVHVFDVGNPLQPVLMAFVPTLCGSHTATAVPDPANDRLLVYSSPSANINVCRGVDIIEIPLSDPAAASQIRFEGSGDPTMNEAGTRPCHDTGVILGDALLAACAGGGGVTVWTLDPSQGGSLEDPEFLYALAIPDVSVGHSASFTWDGEVLIFGHEPGGGVGARCQATSTLVDRTLFFFDARTGTELGRFTHPRPQTATENCTWHNYNVVPTDRYVLVSGNYQSGISVVDFTDPANAVEIAYADPAPLSDNQPIFGGDWSTYWYDGFIYESDARRGLIVWRLSDASVAGAKRLGRLNPQTQETSFPSAR